MVYRNSVEWKFLWNEGSFALLVLNTEVWLGSWFNENCNLGQCSVLWKHIL